MAKITIADLPQDEVIDESELRKVFGGQLAYSARGAASLGKTYSFRTKRTAIPGRVGAGEQAVYVDCWSYTAGRGGLDRIGLFGR